MITMFILVASIYCMAGILVHVYYLFSQAKEQSEKHYVLYTEHNLDVLEWYYYRFGQFSKRMGVNVSITLVSESPVYESSNFISCLRRKEPVIRYTEDINYDESNAIYIHLNQATDLKKLPF